MSSEKPHFHHKLVVLGESNVGKSCIVHRLLRNEFWNESEPTIGAAFLTHKIELEKTDIHLEIWDTAGQERYKSLTPIYYRGASAAVIVFDQGKKDTFEGAKKWITELKRNGETSCVIALVSNKNDLKEDIQVTNEEIEQLQKEENIHIFFKTSAKEGTNIEELFKTIAEACPVQIPQKKALTLEEEDDSWVNCC